MFPTGDDDPMFVSDFKERRLADPYELFTVSFATGREWESEETDDGFTIRTTPDPRLTVYKTANGMVYALCANTPEPMVTTALLVSHDSLTGLIERFVVSIDADYDGIIEITDIEASSGYGHFADAAKTATDHAVPE